MLLGVSSNVTACDCSPELIGVAKGNHPTANLFVADLAADQVGPTSAHTCARARAYTRSRTLIYSSRTWQRNRSVPPAHTRARAHTRTRMHTHTHTHTHTLISLSRTWHRNRSVPPEHTQVRAHTHTRTRARARTHTHKSLGHGPGVGAGPTAAHESRKRGSGYLRQRIDRP